MNTNKTKSTKLAIFCAAAMTALIGTANAEEPNGGKTVVTCTSTSIEGLFHQMIPILGLRELGYKVDMPKTLSVPLVHQSIAMGDCDYAVDEWVPLHQTFYDAVKDLTTRLGPTIAGASQGYLIDKATADAHNIKSLEQFKDPAIAALFDTNGNGKADLAGANPGWGSEKIINNEIAKIGLKDTVDHNQGEYSVLISDVLARFKSGKPVFFYTWTPNWTTAEMKPGEQTVWLTVDPANCSADEPCGTSTSGFPVNDIMILANNEFLKRNPSANAFLSAVRIPLADVNAENLLIHQGQSSEKEVIGHAEKWVADNRAQFDAWLKQARATQ
ncbi:glycine betaine ABC transporter substrate-binding protein [Kaistia sp. 32K]|uniref:glycine betaine/L-proline ABC transporter substrate-binding protein ProX n=1 Tax=Kaistia sp. 32K TaxID=2795690 RepID=UPI0019166940|nr:glycine betaine/L-proline ABC transporter substrate-binding protein ProX [Kaistia sp. 32K]BCP54007.1 glycine betaine ABC transporter substrate-binding protein [Kaistia sp. 32K]